MSLTNAAVVTAPTTFTPSGGATLQFASMGGSAPGKLTLYVPADTDYRVRRTLDVQTKTPTASSSAPNGFTQARSRFAFKKPKLLANGKITTLSGVVEFSYDVEATTAEIKELRDVVAQICTDADFEPAILTGSVA